jgi:membrane protease YdiL (CAAX protease family)
MPAPVPIFVLAIALGYLTRRTGSLVPALTLHALFNGFSTMMLIGSIL